MHVGDRELTARSRGLLLDEGRTVLADRELLLEAVAVEVATRREVTLVAGVDVVLNDFAGLLLIGLATAGCGQERGGAKPGL